MGVIKEKMQKIKNRDSEIASIIAELEKLWRDYPSLSFTQLLWEVANKRMTLEDPESDMAGVPDEDWGSTVRAVVLKKPEKEVTAQEIMDYCKGKMAGYKRPRSVRFATEFPISPVGKVLRQKIRDKYGQPDKPVSD